MNDKTFLFMIIGLLGVGFITISVVAVPWIFSATVVDWKELLLENGIVILAIFLFVFGFYMNTKMH